MCHAFMVFGISKDIYGDGEESSHDCSSSRPSQNSVDAGTLGLNSANRTLRAFSTHATPACRDITLGAHAELRLLRRPIELGFRFRWWYPHVYRTAWSCDTSSGDIEYLRIKQSDEHQPYESSCVGRMPGPRWQVSIAMMVNIHRQAQIVANIVHKANSRVSSQQVRDPGQTTWI